MIRTPRKLLANMRLWQAAVVIWLGLTTSGCAVHSSMQPPDDWHAQAWPVQAIDMQQLASTLQPTAHRPTPPVLQVIICYGHVLSNHACLRLEGPGDQALFWDPGGSFGSRTGRRRGDLLLDRDAITLAQLWQYRSIGCDEPAMLVFEWFLTPQDAQAMRHVLIHGSSNGSTPGAFDNATAGGFCCVNLSGFLRRFSPPHQQLPRKWFWPHNLARQLWKQRPDQVWRFDRSQGLTRYTPPSPTKNNHEPSH